MIWPLSWLIITVIAAWLRPDPHGHGTHQQLGMMPCPSVLLLDRPCPGCGLTTSWTAFVHGDWAASFAAHPLGPITYLAYTASALLFVVAFFRGQVMDINRPIVTRVITVAAITFFAFGLIRMATVTGYRTPTERVMGLSFRR